MKAAAALALVLAVAGAAARSADVRDDVETVIIGEISFTKDNAPPQKADKEITSICLNEDKTFPKEKKIKLNKKVGSVETHYSHTTGNEDTPLNCVPFVAEHPKSGEDVEYVLSFIDGLKQQIGVAKFIFKKLTSVDTFSCDGTDFKRTFFEDGECTADSFADSGYCYEEDASSDPGCITPKEKDFQYCQQITPKVLGDGGAAPIQALSYISNSLVLGGDTRKRSVAVVLNPKKSGKFPQIVKITGETNIPIADFAASTDEYTTCVVVPGADQSTPDTVTKPATITDLYVKGKLIDQYDAKYYEFGFKLAGIEKMYLADSGANQIKVNCEKIDAEADNCFGYVEQEQGDASATPATEAAGLTIKFENNENIIMVDETSLEWPYEQQDD